MPAVAWFGWPPEQFVPCARRRERPAPTRFPGHRAGFDLSLRCPGQSGSSLAAADRCRAFYPSRRTRVARRGSVPLTQAPWAGPRIGHVSAMQWRKPSRDRLRDRLFHRLGRPGVRGLAGGWNPPPGLERLPSRLRWRRRASLAGQPEESPTVPGLYQRSAELTRLEAALFLAREPLSTRRLAKLARLTDGTRARVLLRELKALQDASGAAFRVEQIAGGFRLLTRTAFGPWVRRLLGTPPETRLSAAALETLAIVAYRQPVTRKSRLFAVWAAKTCSGNSWNAILWQSAAAPRIWGGPTSMSPPGGSCRYSG